MTVKEARIQRQTGDKTGLYLVPPLGDKTGNYLGLPSLHKKNKSSPIPLLSAYLRAHKGQQTPREGRYSRGCLRTGGGLHPARDLCEGCTTTHHPSLPDPTRVRTTPDLHAHQGSTTQPRPAIPLATHPASMGVGTQYVGRYLSWMC